MPDIQGFFKDYQTLIGRLAGFAEKMLTRVNVSGC
jgi:hypothetical protein